MKKLLYVIAHPGDASNSQSVAVADVFVDEWKTKNPDSEIKVVDLFEHEPPYYTTESFDIISKQKFSQITGNMLTPDEQKIFDRYTLYVNDFKEADIIVIANPMWNQFLPAELKQYLDLNILSGVSFKFTDHGPVGLLENKPVVHVQAAGGFYHNTPEGAETDFGSKYLDFALDYVGLDAAKSIYIEGAAYVPDQAADIIKNAKQQAIELADELSK